MPVYSACRKERHIIACTVVGSADAQKVGLDADTHVPHMFHKIVTSDAGVLPFLFVRKAQIGTKGCALTAALENCIVKIFDTESLTGLDPKEDATYGNYPRPVLTRSGIKRRPVTYCRVLPEWLREFSLCRSA